MKVPTSIGCTIFKVAKFLSQEFYILMKLITMIKTDLNPKDFADENWHKENDELFANFTDILDAS